MKARANKKRSQISSLFTWLVQKDVTNYQEMKDTFHLSKNTLSQYLDTIEDVLQKNNSPVRLIRKRNVGIFLSGSLDDQQAANQYFTLGETIPQTKDERINYLIASFLTLDRSVTIQQLAEELYVSRRTLENDLKEVKEYFAKKNILHTHDRNGITVKVDELTRRKILGEVINWFWGNQLSVSGKSIFHLADQAKQNLQNMFPLHSIESLEKILGKFVETTHLSFSDYEWQSLFIHLLVMTDRLTEKQYLEDHNLKTQRTEETEKIVSLLEEELNITIPNHEKELINRHFKLFSKELGKEELIETTHHFGDLEKFLEESIDVKYNNQEFIDSLLPHLFSALNRSLTTVSIHNGYKEEIKKLFPLAYEEAIRLTEKIESRYRILLSDDEIAFIALHFETVLSKVYPSLPDKKVEVLLVCNYGVGSSRLLEQRLITNFGQNMTISRLISYKELTDQEITEELVITTIPIDKEKLNGTPLIQVSPFLSEDEIKIIRKFVDQTIKEHSRQASCFIDLLAEKNILIETQSQDYQQMIEKIGARLIENGYAQEGIIQSALTREEIALTSFENISIPHADMHYILDPAIFIAVCPKGIQWGGNIVQVVFFMAINPSVNDSISEIYRLLTEVIDNKKLINDLIKSKDSQELLKKLIEGVS